MPVVNLSVVGVSVAAFIDSLNVTFAVVPMDTAVVPLAGDTEVTVGAEAVAVVEKTTSTQ